MPGPWLEPGFREKGFNKLDDRKAIAKQLIDRFNATLSEVAALQEFTHVSYVNLRNTLSVGSNYKQLWENELHPTVYALRKLSRMVSTPNRCPLCGLCVKESSY